MFQHFGNRLKRDLKHLVERRLDASVKASGSLQKVCCYYYSILNLFLKKLRFLSLPVSKLMLFHINANGSYLFYFYSMLS